MEPTFGVDGNDDVDGTTNASSLDLVLSEQQRVDQTPLKAAGVTKKKRKKLRRRRKKKKGKDNAAAAAKADATRRARPGYAPGPGAYDLPSFNRWDKASAPRPSVFRAPPNVEVRSWKAPPSFEQIIAAPGMKRGGFDTVRRLNRAGKELYKPSSSSKSVKQGSTKQQQGDANLPDPELSPNSARAFKYVMKDLAKLAVIRLVSQRWCCVF